MFFHASQETSSTLRLLRLNKGLGERGGSRATHTTIFAELTRLRNEAFRAAYDACVAAADGAGEDLGLDAPLVQKRKVRPHVLVVGLRAPTVGRQSSIDLKALCTKEGAPLHIELTAPCLDYLRYAIAHQKENSDASGSTPSMPLPRSCVKGVTRLGSRQSYRVKFRDEEMGKRRQKTFSASVHGVDGACEFAIVFNQSRVDKRKQETIVIEDDD